MSLIDKNSLKQFKKTLPLNPELQRTCMYNNGWNDGVEYIIRNAEDIEAVDVKFIINLIQSSSGAYWRSIMKNIKEYLKNQNMRISFDSSSDGVDIYIEDGNARVTINRVVSMDEMDCIDDILEEMIKKLTSGASMLSNYKKEHDKRKEIWSLFINE